MFIPKDRKFFDMLKDLSGKTHEGAKLFYSFVSNYVRLSPEKRKSLIEELKKIEHDCVSTTHVIASSIMGVGLAKKASGVRWGVARKIIVAWLLTIPMSAFFAGVSHVLIVKLL